MRTPHGSKKMDWYEPARLLATWFGSGLLPGAPGTWGSLAALPFAAVILWIGGSALLLGASILIFLIGIWASNRYAESIGKKDPGAVVIDEVAGQWLALTPVCLEPVGFLVGFALFRTFDILKTWPANWLERSLPGGLGIMSDDMVAGFYSAIGTVLILDLIGIARCWTVIF